MDADEIKAMARQALAEMRGAALHDGETWARPGGDRNVDDACASLAGMIDRPRAPNPAYADFGETAASLVLLASTDPEAYLDLIEPILGKYGRARAGTMWGPVFLANFLSSVNDDHDYALDRTGPRPVVRMQHEIPAWTPGLTPKGLLEAVRPMLERPPVGPRL